MTDHVESRIKSKDLRPGDKIKARGWVNPSSFRVIHSRKSADDSAVPGWWLTYPDHPEAVSGGIADSVFDERWVLVERAEDHVWVPISLLERLQKHYDTGTIYTPLAAKALIDYLPQDPRKAKVEELAKVIAEAYVDSAVGFDLMSEGAKDSYRKMAEAALDHLEQAQ